MTPNELDTGTVAPAAPAAQAPAPSTPAAQAPSPAPKAPAKTPAKETPKAEAPKADDSLSVGDRLKQRFADAKKKAEKPSLPAEEATSEATPVVETPEADATNPAASEFKPNFKLKVMDKEMEIPEEFRSLVTDAASEKKVREIFEKAYGLDHVKPKHEQTKKDLGDLRVQHQQVASRMQNWESNYAKVQSAASSEDPIEFEQFLNFWKIPKEKLYAHAAYRLQLDELDPVQRAEIDRRNAEVLRGRQAQDQLQQVQGQASFQAVQMRLAEVDRMVTRPDISEVAREYDTRQGKAGAFKELVVERGQLAAAREGKDISPDEAIRRAMALLGYEEVADDGQQAAAPQGQQPGAAAPATQPVVQAPKKLPVLPTVGAGNGTAPVKKLPGSLADLKKMRADMQKAK